MPARASGDTLDLLGRLQRQRLRRQDALTCNDYESLHVPSPPQASGDALDLLGRMLSLDPARRVSSAEALRHPYFANNPQPTPPQLLPRPLRREDAPLASGPAGAAAGAKGRGTRKTRGTCVRRQGHRSGASGLSRQ